MFKKVSLDKQMSEILYKVIISVKLKECQELFVKWFLFLVYQFVHELDTYM